MKNKGMISIKEALEEFLKEKKWDKKIRGYNVVNYWEDFVGKEISRHSHPIKLQNRTLFLRVKNSVWANELNLRKGEIIEKINLSTKEETVSDILFKVQPSYFASDKTPKSEID